MNEDIAPAVNTDPKTVEDVFIRRDIATALPKEYKLRPLTKENRPKTVKKADDINSNFSVPYDISYRRDGKSEEYVQKEPFPLDVDPTIVNVIQHYKKPNKSLKRAVAQELAKELQSFDAPSAEDFEDEDVISTLQRVQRSISAHNNVMKGFVENSKKYEPERTELLKKITDHYSAFATEIPKICDDFQAKIYEAREVLTESKSDHESLRQTKGNLKLAIEKQNRTIFNLRQQIEDYKAKCSNAEVRLRDATNEKMAIERSSQCNKDKLKQLTQQIEEKKNRTKSIGAMVGVLNSNLDETASKLSNVSDNLKNLEEQIQNMIEESHLLDKQTNDDDEQLEVLSQVTNTSNVKKKAKQDIGVQVSILQQQKMKERKMQQKKEAAERNEKKNSQAGTKEDFQQNKSDMALIRKKMGEDISINNMSDLREIRKLILQNNRIFDWGANSISRARAGNYPVKSTGNDQSSLYAKWFLSRIMKRVVSCVEKADVGIQMENPNKDETKKRIRKTKSKSSGIGCNKVQESNKAQEVNKAHIGINDFCNFMEEEEEEEDHVDKKEEELSVLFKNARFAKLLNPNYSKRKPRDVNWLIHSIRSIYDEKYVDDQTEVLELDKYIMKWAFRQFGREDLIQKGCWDLLISAYYHMQRSLEVMLFVHFLDGMWTLEQLTFFLNSRAWIIKRCVSVAMQNDSVDEYLTETFMTRTQVADYFRLFCPDAEPDLVEDLNIRSCNCADPKRGGLDDSSIPMMRVLEIAVGEKEAKRIRRLRKMLAKYKVKQRMTKKWFVSFTRSLISNLDMNIIDSLYHSSQVSNSYRKNINFEEFAERYKAGLDDEDIPDFGQYNQQYALTNTRWENFRPFLTKIIERIDKVPGDEGKTLANEIRHKMFQMLEAKVAYDGELFFENYHKLLQSVLFACMKFNLPDSYLFQKQISDFESRLIEKYNRATKEQQAKDSKN